MNEPAPQTLYAGLAPRLRALVFDMVIYAIVLVALLIAADLPFPDILSRLLLLLLAGFLVLYEPVAVWRFGGTIGHYRQNLRVVSDKTDGPPGPVASLLRWGVKGLFGIVSFSLIALTKRHQTLHDLASSSTMQVRDGGEVQLGDFVEERHDARSAVDVSVARRLLVIGLYQVGLFVLMNVAAAVAVSESCLMSDICTPTEDAVASLLGLSWLTAVALVIVFGWRAKLLGARGGHPNSA